MREQEHVKVVEKLNMKHQEEVEKLKAEIKLLRHTDQFSKDSDSKVKMVERIRALLVEEIERLDAINAEKILKLRNEVDEMK